ncbi:methyltransferase domain-containing protein [Synechococcales cyanobacterium C]|uniref:Methyltransferase domain-containing protein n=1 Tax=Petrachloros mirabilis ULC683 TaxID=2781853 RepID=A0A8K2A253_9CYAN|nr:class I SAM-dependent methyltransferase [Petrachloros mirabilis]NCJ08348.1 methyltransferase domain-containing protein [Petrachloros mirabilis ULC683]
MTVKIHSRDLSTISYYDLNAEEYFIRLLGANIDIIYKKFLDYVPEGITILDAGCGSGRDTKYFAFLGHKVFSIDASQEMVEISTKYTQKKTHLMNFYDLKFENEFNAIWSMASLIHIPKNDMDYIVRLFTEALRVNGIWLISLKEGEGEEIEEDRLFNRYTEEEFRLLLEKHSCLQIEKLWHSLDAIGRSQNWLTVILRKIY